MAKALTYKITGVIEISDAVREQVAEALGLEEGVMPTDEQVREEEEKFVRTEPDTLILSGLNNREIKVELVP